MNGPRKGFWDFCCEHPIACIILAFVVMIGITDIAEAITGHHEHDNDGFWSGRLTPEAHQ